MGKRVSARRIKMHRLYTYEEAADALKVTPQTIRSWRRDGLVVLVEQIPHIVPGFALKDFLTKREIQRRQTLGEDDLFCLRCKTPRKPYGMMADYVPIGQNRGRLEALCAVCESVCNRFIHAADLPAFAGKLEIVSKCVSDA